MNLGYTLWRSTAHMVSKVAFLRSIVDAVRLICLRKVGMWVSERSGGMKAPRTLVGTLRGIGVMGIGVASIENAWRDGVGGMRV